MVFLQAKYGKTNLLSAQHCTLSSTIEINKILEIETNQYLDRKLEIPNYHGNNEFDISKLHDLIQPVTINIYDKDKHFGPIERSVLTVKESRRSVYHSVSYRRTPKLMTTSLVKGVNNWLIFLSTDGIPETMGPAMI